MEEKRIWDIYTPYVGKLFRSIQIKRGITNRHVDAFWLVILSLKVGRRGITERELKKEIERYYDTHENGI